MKDAVYTVRIFLLQLLLFVSENGVAQVYFNARALTASNGLSDNRITCFYKDRKGFMWIGTKNGLNRYDGHSFKIFRPGSGNSISNEVINDIEEDREGRIWVATMEGLNFYDPVQNKWGLIMPDTKESALDLPNFIVWDIWFDQNGLLWIASDVFEFTSYDIHKKKFTYYDWPSFARSRLNFPGTGKYSSILKFTAAGNEEFWLGTTKGLVKLNTRTKEFSFAGGGYYSDVTDLRYDKPHQKVYLSVQEGRLFSYDEKDKVYRVVPVLHEPYPSIRFSVPGKNELWLASVNGLVKIDDNRKQASLMVHIPQISGSLLPGVVSSIFIDDNMIRWVGTTNGISVYDPINNESSFLPLLNVSGKEEMNRVGGALFDSASNCYFVCTKTPAAVFIINSSTGAIKKVTTDAKGKTLSSCMTVKADRQKELWLLTEKNVYRYDRLSGQFILFPTPLLSKTPVFRDMVQDAEGNYWFSSYNGKIFYYKTKEKSFHHFEDTVTGNISSATGLAFDPVNKKIFIGTFGTYLFMYDLVSKKISGFYDLEINRNYSRLNLVNDIATDHKGRVWVATHTGGVFRYEPGMPYEKSFTQFDMRKGLDNNSILSLCSDGDSTIWLLSANGISAISSSGRFLFSLKQEQVFSFSSYFSDNKLPHYISYNPFKKELLTGVGGGLLFYSSIAPDTSLHFPVVLTSIKAGADEIAKGATAIPFHYKTISFQFAGLYYGNSTRLSYQYKLEGYDKEWQKPARGFEASYQNLPAGHYRFQARAVDDQGNIKGDTGFFSFYIKPPFWQTGWFILLLVFISAALLYRFISSLRQKLKTEKLLNSFATSLYGQNTVDDILWDTARNCIEKIGFADCVIYQKDETRGMLIQRAAFGPKNPARREILNPIEIPEGKGIVGAVAKTGKAEIVKNTMKDPRYIVDDEKRLSEISVPVIVDRKVFAVIDSEHPQKNFFRQYHLRLLQKIAAICAERISKYLAEERIRTKIARDLHDEMGSTLTSINITSKVAMQEGMQEEKVKQYLQKIKDNSGRMMESMSDIVWAINPANDSFDKVVLRMKEFAAEILEPARINYYFNEEGELDKVQLNLEQRKDIYMIFKEALNNAVKYSGATEINITLQKREEALRMILMDNGNGFDSAGTFPGNGLKNMQGRSAEMKAGLRIDSIKGAGTTVILEVGIT
ncbi:MAG: GAF domain-containing protein [Sphingobacteriales bacterium]|nr:GAF domain-containing protein [Sphingobacteriales bacterium]